MQLIEAGRSRADLRRDPCFTVDPNSYKLAMVDVYPLPPPPQLTSTNRPTSTATSMLLSAMPCAAAKLLNAASRCLRTTCHCKPELGDGVPMRQRDVVIVTGVGLTTTRAVLQKHRLTVP